MAVISMEGFYDLHVHTGPSPFKRVGDTIDIGRWCADAGMAGIVAKAHLESSVTKAYHANKELSGFPDFKVYAAICLNRGVGGIAPAAVEVALDEGAKIVWFPTFDAQHHVDLFGAAGSYGFKGSHLAFKGGRSKRGGYSAIDANGKLTAESKEVVDIIIAYDAILASGHISKAEIYALAEYGQSQGLKRMVVTHPEAGTPNLDAATMADLARQGVYMEFTASHFYAFAPNTPGGRGVTIDQLKEFIAAVGVEKSIISSDAGHIIFPRPPEMLRSFLQMIHEKGVSEEAIRTMCADNPGYLIGATPQPNSNVAASMAAKPVAA